MSKEERHRHILETAKRLFQERGYDKVTIADVIHASNIARGTFYLHFSSLEELLMALFEQTVEQTWKRIAPILEDLSIPFRQCTIEVVRAVFRMHDEDPSMARVFFMGGGETFVRHRDEAMYHRLGGLLVEALRRRHNVDIPHLDWTAAMLIALVADMSLYAQLYVPVHERKAFEQGVIDFVLAGLRTHLAPHVDPRELETDADPA
ncbi:MAG: TetR/AcrR family transcriptional regulator [Thermoflavifilum sp.]|nr:TetR/AcrR family transcriptional regulator [Thermoflavifilum sp.]